MATSKAAKTKGTVKAAPVGAVEPKKTGRPTIRTEAVEDALCELVAQGLPLVQATKEVGVSMPSLFRWLAEDEAFQDKYVKAKEAQAELMASEIIAIADEVEVVAKVDGEETILALDSTAVARNRLRVDARKWVASKLLPKKYGDKITNEHTGEGGGPVQVSVNFVKASQ